MDFASLDIQPLLEWLSEHGINIVIVLLSMLFANYLLGKIVRGIQKTLLKRFSSEESKKRLKTLVGVLRLIARSLVIIVGLMIILSEIGLDMGPILATVGVLGLGISLGAQTLFRDLIGGFFILLEDKIRVGDVVTINGLTGTVESVQMRVLVLRALNGDVHVIPNGAIQEFTNSTKDYSRALWNIGVGYSEDIDRVMDVIRDEGEKLTKDEEWAHFIRSELVILGLQELADSALIIRCIMDTNPGNQWAITREFNRRIKKRFDMEGIEIPFPHRTIYYGNKPGTIESKPEISEKRKGSRDDSSS